MRFPFVFSPEQSIIKPLQIRLDSKGGKWRRQRCCCPRSHRARAVAADGARQARPGLQVCRLRCSRPRRLHSCCTIAAGAATLLNHCKLSYSRLGAQRCSGGSTACDGSSHDVSSPGRPRIEVLRVLDIDSNLPEVPGRFTVMSDTEPSRHS